ncbi:MAG: SpoIID/LytB domain-containing protein [Bacillota bacterium]
MDGKTISSRPWWWIAGAVVLIVAVVLAVRAVRGPALKPVPMIDEPTITISYDATGKKGTIKMEDYLAGVVAAEMPTDGPAEALKAQAIVARTYTMKKIAQGGVKKLHGTDVCDNPEHFQAYDAAKVNEAVKQAVAATRGQVVTYRNGYILAWFHANSGGRTATAQEGLEWRGEATPYITVVRDVAGSEGVRPWTATFTKADVASAVIRVTGKDPGDFKDIRVTNKGPSGRAVTLTIGKATVSGPSLRIALGSEKLRSTLFTQITVSGDTVTFAGDGFGHGVGMAQDGAKAQAARGKRAADIVRFYYKGTQVTQRWR